MCGVDMAESKPPGFQMDPGAFNAALFRAYKGDCDCMVCRILREAVEKSIDVYLPKGDVKRVRK